MHKPILSFLLCFILFPCAVSAASAESKFIFGIEESALEPINAKESTALTALRTVLESNHVKLEVIAMPYSRAVVELQRGNIDAFGFSAFNYSDPTFYSIASEIKFPIRLTNELFGLDETKFHDIDNTNIGTTYGNEEYVSKILGKPQDQILTSTVESLVRMMLIGRLDLVWLERSAMIRTLKKHNNIPIIWRMPLPSFPVEAGIFVSHYYDGVGKKKMLENAISNTPRRFFEITQKEYFQLTSKDLSAKFRLVPEK